MELRNSLESVVTEIVDTLLKGRKDICQCGRCRLDMQAYALNQLPPRYIVSERGITHREMNLLKDAQFNADIVQTVAEAVAAISSRPRPGFKHSVRTGALSRRAGGGAGGAAFHFPHLLGTVFLNREMDPAPDARVTLLTPQGKPVKMSDPSWPNPYVVSGSTGGLFSFWPAAVAAEKPGKSGKSRALPKTRDFEFVLSVSCRNRRVRTGLSVRAETASTGSGHARRENILRLPAVFLDTKA